MSTPPDLDLENKTLETLYNTSQKSTLTFQKQHDILKSQESILYTLRDKYYEALVNKKWHEQDRDIYFEHDKHVSDLRQNLIDKSIQVLQEQRAYYRSSQSYHVNVNETVKNRDRKIKNLEFKLNSVEKEHSDMESLYQKRGAEIMELSADLKIARAESLNLKSTTDEFESKFNALKQKLVDQVDETRKFQNVSNQLKSKLDKSVGKRESLETRNEDLECQITAQKTELADQLKIIEKMTHKLNEEVLQSKKQHDTFVQTESIFELKTIEMKNKIVGYQNEVSKYVTQTDVLKVKCQELGIRLTSTDKKYKSLKQDREKVVSKEYSTRRENVEINERYHALLERAMELIESDANKNVHLQKLISDNIRLCFRSGKRNNTPVLRPKTQEALRRAEEQVDYVSRKTISSARRKMRNPGTLLRTSQDIKNLGFMAGKGLDLNITPYRAVTPNAKTWDTTRPMTWNTRQGHVKMTTGAPGRNKRVVNLLEVQ